MSKMQCCVRTENVVRCPSCGEAYEVFNMMVGDQSRCPACLDKLAKEVEENRSSHERETRKLSQKDWCEFYQNRGE